MSEESKVVDLGAKRLDKVIKDSGAPVLGGKPPEGAFVVSVLGCTNCGSNEFRLGHHDPLSRKDEHVILCAKCCILIPSLSWYDVNAQCVGPKDPAA
jgi:hypothetical protein